LHVYRLLRTAIEQGSFAPGARLPPSREQARLLGVSRNSVLWALERLQAEGYVVARVGDGSYVAPDLSALLERSIVDSHCGTLDADTARRMTLAQVARDQAMAGAIEAQAARGAVLLAGNGHVRIDAGAPRWLSPATAAALLHSAENPADGHEPRREDQVTDQCRNGPNEIGICTNEVEHRRGEAEIGNRRSIRAAPHG